ncbi:hypothetical protein MXB_515, partial [Myxobolus squamalis]
MKRKMITKCIAICLPISLWYSNFSNVSGILYNHYQYRLQEYVKTKTLNYKKEFYRSSIKFLLDVLSLASNINEDILLNLYNSLSPINVAYILAKNDE